MPNKCLYNMDTLSIIITTNRHMKLKKPEVHAVMNVRHPMGVLLYSFSIKNSFYDKMFFDFCLAKFNR